MLLEGAQYIKVHKVTGHQCGPRLFLNKSELGYYLFVGEQEGAIISESLEVWNFFKTDDTTRPPPIPIPAGWVEGPGGYYDPTLQRHVGNTGTLSVNAAINKGYLEIELAKINPDPLEYVDFLDGEEVVVLQGNSSGPYHIFKKDSIEKWFATHSTNPLTNLQIAQTDIDLYTLRSSSRP